MCEGNAPYTDPLAQECVAECRPGQEIKGGIGADKMHCRDCEAGRFADHLNNLCGVECPTGTIENEDARNCDADDSATLGDALAHHSNANDTHSDCDSSAPYRAPDAPTQNCDEDALSVVLGSAQHLECTDSEPYLSGAPVPSCVSKCPIGQGANGTNYCVECVGNKPYADHASHR